ncbi:MAG: NAD-dependent epimerase/dehydratase family protein [Flavobacteriaceae bacterium]|nr:NAD-dependent epimerase/dehydratase family protein [Bacteroidia bacterium]NNK70004.1 NAD-dependent epimerase/dehydratase family protein [Flavobacteriaceae bacterium]
MILVTGGTGLVGSHLLFKLSKKHQKIRAIYRNEKKIDKVKHVFSYYTDSPNEQFDKIEWINSNLNDLQTLSDAFNDITHVYHCAAMVSFDPADYHQLRKSNIEGTANIINLSLENNIEKMAYVSSVAALGGKDLNQPITEESPWNPDGDHHVYAITKYGAEMEVWRGVQEGLKAIIVNPGIIVGPGFWRSSSGALFNRISRGMKYYVESVNGYVSIHDVITPMINLMESDISNERFIQVSDNMTSKSFIDLVAKELNVKPPVKEASKLMLQLGWRYDWIRAKILGKRRRLTKRTAKALSRDSHYDNSKLTDRLNFQYSPIQSAIAETAKYFIEDQD